MIQCRFLVDSENACCVGIEFSGHAGGEKGTDIVCAAVSSAVYLTANAVTDVLFVKADITAEDGYLRLQIPVADEPKCRPFFRALEVHIQNLREEYPKSINMSNKEV
ncbi:ribosomal-processing cysteine protease Prp [Caproicibacterium amylolyticum]|jgi:hypothetical protein|uniref:Ribosomal processing cysteine protease Prp n=1 Tax=Caproicibacterium amylolyticum TaxID=2766537 RepID=A0A7G9WEG4_9FIRM|nr:ribosomal-processing cysteine protease Prp [Caproicibacterium amylolyticum]QNO17076.1 ribosomal-processing cysteine protease Prp [Caproicibacterium amylolyticum]